MRIALPQAARLLVLLGNCVVYATFIWASFALLWSQQIEGLVLDQTSWPVGFAVFFKLSNVTSLVVLGFTVLYAATGQRSLLGLIAVAIGVHAFAGIGTYLQLWISGIPFNQSPVAFWLPPALVFLAVANTLVYRNHRTTPRLADAPNPG